MLYNSVEPYDQLFIHSFLPGVVGACPYTLRPRRMALMDV